MLISCIDVYDSDTNAASEWGLLYPDVPVVYGTRAAKTRDRLGTVLQCLEQPHQQKTSTERFLPMLVQ